jgi:hypothetical protein
MPWFLLAPFLAAFRWWALRKKTSRRLAWDIVRVCWATLLCAGLWGWALVFLKNYPGVWLMMSHGRNWDMGLEAGLLLAGLTFWAWAGWSLLLNRAKKTG